MLSWDAIREWSSRISEVDVMLISKECLRSENQTRRAGPGGAICFEDSWPGSAGGVQARHGSEPSRTLQGGQHNRYLFLENSLGLFGVHFLGSFWVQIEEFSNPAVSSRAKEASSSLLMQS